MRTKLNNTAALWLVILMLLPPLIRLEHHHDHFVCKEKNQKHIHEHHQKCVICSFEFSLFLSRDAAPLQFKNEVADTWSSLYRVPYISFDPRFSFLLRAPPLDNHDFVLHG